MGFLRVCGIKMNKNGEEGVLVNGGLAEKLW
jgi:hypothetical protein